MLKVSCFLSRKFVWKMVQRFESTGIILSLLVQHSLLEVLPDFLNAEVVAGTITSKQDAMDYITWTYFFRRLIMNPRCVCVCVCHIFIISASTQSPSSLATTSWRIPLLPPSAPTSLNSSPKLSQTLRTHTALNWRR